MKGFSNLRRTGILGVTALLLSSGIINVWQPAIAQNLLRLRLPDVSAPGNRQSGSTRSTTCIAPRHRLTALVPQTNYGQTQADYPTFYFYLPPTDARQVKFVLLNDATNEFVYEGRFSINGTSGIVGVSLPNNGLQQPLEVEQTYVWYLAVVCDVNDPSADVVVEGYVNRVAPLAASVDMSSTDLPALYAEAGLWYDALAASASLKVTDRTSEWNTLLDAVELNELIPIPLLNTELSSQEQSISSDSLEY